MKKTLKNYLAKVTIITHTKKVFEREVLAENAIEAETKIVADIERYDGDVRGGRCETLRCEDRGSEGTLLSVDRSIEIKEAE